MIEETTHFLNGCRVFETRHYIDIEDIDGNAGQGWAVIRYTYSCCQPALCEPCGGAPVIPYEPSFVDVISINLDGYEWISRILEVDLQLLKERVIDAHEN